LKIQGVKTSDPFSQNNENTTWISGDNATQYRFKIIKI